MGTYDDKDLPRRHPMARISARTAPVLLLTLTCCGKPAPDSAERDGCTVTVSVHAPRKATVTVEGEKAEYDPDATAFVAHVALDKLSSPARASAQVDGAVRSIAVTYYPWLHYGHGEVKDGVCAVVSTWLTGTESLANHPDTLDNLSGDVVATDFERLNDQSYELDAPSVVSATIQGKTAEHKGGTLSFKIDREALALTAPSDQLLVETPPKDVPFSVPMVLELRDGKRRDLKLAAHIDQVARFRQLAIDRLRRIAAAPLPGQPATGAATLVFLRGVVDPHLVEHVEWIGAPSRIDEVRWVALETLTNHRKVGSCSFTDSFGGGADADVVLDDSQLVILDAHTGKALDEKTFVATRGGCPSSWSSYDGVANDIRFGVDRQTLLTWAQKRIVRGG